MSTGPQSLEPVAAAPLAVRGSAVQALPRRQAGWIAVQALTAGGLVAAGLWSTQPELALSLSIGAGAVAVNPRKAWTAPLVVAAVALAGLATAALDWPPILGAGAAAGALAAWLLPEHTDWLDHVHGALATAAGATLGLWTANHLLPDLVGSAWGAVLGATLVGLVASQGIVPLALRWDNPAIPTARQVRRTLQPAYRPAVFQAIALYTGGLKASPDALARRGMAEIVNWVYKLALTMQSFDQDLAVIDPARIQERIQACEDDPTGDEFTRERRQATAAHLRRLLEHRKLIETERKRTHADVDYALAFLEEARAGLTIARELPGEATPDRLPEVLHRLRTHAAAGDARRKTAREMHRIDV